MIGRLILSDRNIFKIKSGNKQVSARKCNILSESLPDILIKTSKEFSPKDEYIKFDPKTNTIVEGLGQVGIVQTDLDIYYHLMTNGWILKKKWNRIWEEYLETNPQDLALISGIERLNYKNQVITIDPENSIDLDDGFSFSYNDEYYNLDIHIADPVSWFNFTEPKFNAIFKELELRLQSCYLSCESINSLEPTHLLPHDIVNLISLLEIKPESSIRVRRAITFQFTISKHTNHIEKFNIIHTNLSNIKNYTYSQYDNYLNSVFCVKFKNELINLVNILRNIIGLSKITYPDLSGNSNISHSMIEIFMILTNWYGGNYLISNLSKTNTIIRTQDKKDLGEDFNIIIVPEYARPYLSVSANYINHNDSTTQTHYSLGISNYAHLSSPMRRFIDMINHLGFYNIEKNEKFNLNLEKINLKIKNQKKISNGWKLVNFLKSNPELNKFKACLFDWMELKNSNKITGILVLNQEEKNFISMVNVELPQIEETINLSKYMEFNVELFYNSNNFKSSKFPFSIKII